MVAGFAVDGAGHPCGCMTASMSLFDRFSLAGKRLFITGGSRGLGREMALALAEAGADAILTGRDPDSLAATAAEIRALGREGRHDRGRHGRSGPVRGRLPPPSPSTAHRPVVNNVGGRLVNVPVAEQSLEDWQRILDLNLTSTFLCTRLIGGEMVRRGNGGRVINVASISGMVANRGIGGRSYETPRPP